MKLKVFIVMILFLSLSLFPIAGAQGSIKDKINIRVNDWIHKKEISINSILSPEKIKELSVKLNRYLIDQFNRGLFQFCLDNNPEVIKILTLAYIDIWINYNSWPQDPPLDQKVIYFLKLYWILKAACAMEYLEGAGITAPLFIVFSRIDALYITKDLLNNLVYK